MVINGRNKYLEILDEAWQAHLAPKEPDAPIFISLFAGCGGSSLGYSIAGYRELLAVDWDKNAVATFKLNFPGVPVWQSDIHDLAAREILGITGLRPGELDLLDGSPPCQGFSTAGKRNMGDLRNQLYNEFVRILEELQPKIFVMENVSGMVKGKMKLVFADCTRRLKGAGYRVRCKLLNAMYFSVPQSRERLIWVGARDDLATEPAYPGVERRPFSVAEALADLLPGVAGQASPFRRADHVRACRNEMHRNEWKSGDAPSPTMMANRPPVMLLDDGRKRGWKTDRPAFTVGANRRPELHSPSVLTQWEDRGKRFVGSHQSVRLEAGKASPTQIGAHRNWHPGEARQLTDRECARLQSFPDGFRFAGGRRSIQRQIGNSVPPLFMKAIAEHIRQEILGLTSQLADG